MSHSGLHTWRARTPYSTMRWQHAALWMSFVDMVALVFASDLELSSSGMTVLKAVYGASCGFGTSVADEESYLTDYVKALCDGKEACSGVVDTDVIYNSLSRCAGDFHVVAVCHHGEIRSFSSEGEAAGEEFHIDCTSRKIPALRQHPDWMSSMEDVLMNTTIKQLHLPGSHHSGTSSFDMMFYHLAKCQNIRVGQQLIAGVRYLDYRIGSIDEVQGARVIHGPLYSQIAIGDLLEIWAFSVLHPREFFILDLQHTSSLSTRHAGQLSVWLAALFHRSGIYQWSVPILQHTMGDVWASGRRILIVQDQPLSGLVWHRNVLYGRWPNVCTGDTLSDHVTTQLSELPHRAWRLVMLEWIITVKFQCLSSLYGRSMAIRDELKQWLVDNDHGFTIILTDFTLQPLDEEGIVELIIESNRS